MEATRDTIFSTIILTLALIWATCCPAQEPVPVNQAPTLFPTCKCENCRCAVCECGETCRCPGCQVKAEPVRIYLFSATWCGPCQTQKPAFLKVAETSSIPMTVVDIDDEPELAQKFGVREIPCIGVEKNGKRIRYRPGVMSEGQIRGVVREAGK